MGIQASETLAEYFDRIRDRHDNFSLGRINLVDTPIRLGPQTTHQEDPLGPPLKFDKGKPMWHLLPLDCISGVVKVLTFGATKYAPDNWKKVTTQQYFSAANRHLEAIANGEENDSESNLPHAFHYLCNCIFITWKLIRGDNQWLKDMYNGS